MSASPPGVEVGQCHPLAPLTEVPSLLLGGEWQPLGSVALVREGCPQEPLTWVQARLGNGGWHFQSLGKLVSNQKERWGEWLLVVQEESVFQGGRG